MHRSKREVVAIALVCTAVAGCSEEEVPMPEGTTGEGAFFSALYGPGIGTEEMEVARATERGVLIGGFSDGFDDEDGDGWLVELDPAGRFVSQGTLGGKGAEMILDLVVLDDGGIVGTGWTQSAGAGGYDVWCFRLTADRDVVWSYAYGGDGAEQGWSITPTTNGNFVVAGGTTSFGAGGSDLWILEIDGAGMPVWQKALGGPADDAGAGEFEEFTARVMEGPTGRLVAVTETQSFGAGDADVWALGLDGDGSVLWQNAYGGADEDTVWSAALASDGRVMVPAVTSSFGPDGSGDVWWLVLDEDGGISTQRVLGEPGIYDEPISVVPTFDGGAVLGVSGYPEGAWQDILLRLDADGMPLWHRRYDMGWSWTNALVADADEAITVAGVYWGGDPQPDVMDLWVMRLSFDGDLTACDRIEDTDLHVEETAAGVTSTSAVETPTMVEPVPADVTWTATQDRPRYYCGP